MSVARGNGSRAVPVITIDGPVGSGKGTIASRLANSLGWSHLDSGALYRLVALLALRQGLAEDHAGRLQAVAENLGGEFRFEGGETRVYLEGEDVTRALRAEAVSAMASKVAAVQAVREALAERQKAFASLPGLVADGRDMGTVIFPDAVLKIYLTATVQARAERRYKQLKDKGESVNLSRLFRDLEERDARDSNRAIAPLAPAQDAVIVDSTGMSVEEVLEEILRLVEDKSLTN